MEKTLADIGEFGLIDRIQKLIKKKGIYTSSVTLGIGDDTASISPRLGYELLITCDCLLEGRHFLFEQTTPIDLGRRAMVANISDIGAMGGHPLYALISLGLKENMTVKAVEDMYRGFLRELNPLKASIVGGNITKTQDAIFIDITLIGEAEQGKLMRRSTAQTGDAILITGYPGQAAAGLRLLMQSQLGEDLKDHPLVHAYNTPSHRALIGKAIALSGFAKAMIDTSDGFLGDLGHICKESGVGAELVQEKFPISKDLKQGSSLLGLNPYDFFLKDSDDYELIITCSPDNVNKIRSTISAVSAVSVTEVGKLTEKARNIELILPDGSRRHVSPIGWDHFAK